MYEKLIKLTEETESFFYRDFTLDDAVYRTFLYRLASYSDFCLPGALESRGIMYRIDTETPKLVCRPMQKFFNYRENPFTHDVDFGRVTHVSMKEDGSLISSYLHNGKLMLKTKGSNRI